jgi:hypothetical protein
MSTSVLNLSGDAAPRIELTSYNLMLPMGTLAIGVDNIHHDVYLSPKFVQASRDYLFELIRQHTASNFMSGVELRNAKTIDGAGFRKLLSELLQSAVTQAKFCKNIEIDILFRLAILKFITQELVNQFANIILECSRRGAPCYAWWGSKLRRWWWTRKRMWCARRDGLCLVKILRLTTIC